MLFLQRVCSGLLLPLQRFRYLLLGWFCGTAVFFWGNLADRVHPDHHFLLQFLFNAHNFEFLLGSLAAYLVLQHPLKRQNTFFLLLGTTCFVLFGVAQAERSLNLKPILAYGIPSTLIVLGSASLDLQRSCHPASAPFTRLFTSLGNASYAIYLTHYLCLSVLLKLIVATPLLQRGWVIQPRSVC